MSVPESRPDVGFSPPAKPNGVKLEIVPERTRRPTKRRSDLSASSFYADKFEQNCQKQPMPLNRKSLLTAVGIFLVVIWTLPFLFLAAISFLGTLMANDSGAASSTAHLILIVAVFVGLLLIGLAGIPAGLAVFMAGRRRALLLTGLGAILVGLALVFGSYLNFTHSIQEDQSGSSSGRSGVSTGS